MNFSSLTGVLWRQRLFVIPAAVCAALFCVLVYVSAPPTYRASGSIVLLNPPALPQTQMGGPSVPSEWQNPYTRIGDLGVVVDILVRVVGSEPVLAELVDQGFVGAPTVAGNRGFYSGPIVDVAAEAPTAEATIKDVSLLIAELQTQLAELQQQQGTAEQYTIKSDVVITPDQATTVFSGTARLLIVAAGASGLLVVGVGLLTDRLRRPKRSKEASSADQPAATELVEVPTVHATAVAAAAPAAVRTSPNGDAAKRRLSAAGQVEVVEPPTAKSSSSARRRDSTGRGPSRRSSAGVRRQGNVDNTDVVASSDPRPKPAQPDRFPGLGRTEGDNDPEGATVDRAM